ncbi:MAG: TetR/AcrR family transcriptional regulator [Candidatus Omnitrophica bacterium]|nr:TetR/AcrR family transcriptional regulator [Candidatus Omnitrophota bacterium]
MKSSKEKTVVRQAQIIAAALDVIAKDGFKGLTIAAIAKKVGITNSNVYRHFSGREAIVEAIVSEVEISLQKIISEACSKNNLPSQCLENIFLKHIEFLETHRGIPRVIFSDEMYSGNELLIRRLRGIVKQYMGGIKKVLKKGVEEKEFDSGLDIDAAAMTFMGFIQSTALQWILFRYSFSPKKRGKKIWKIYLRGIYSR